MALEALGDRLVGQPICPFVLGPRDMLDFEGLETLDEMSDQNVQPLELSISHAIIAGNLTA